MGYKQNYNRFKWNTNQYYKNVVEYSTSGETVNIVYSGATQGWIPLDDGEVVDAPVGPTQRGIFGFGTAAAATGVTNLVNSSGVIAADVSAVGTARNDLSAAGYGRDKGIFRGGYTNTSVSMTNLVNSSGVVASDVTGVGTGVTSGVYLWGGTESWFS